MGDLLGQHVEHHPCDKNHDQYILFFSKWQKHPVSFLLSSCLHLESLPSLSRIVNVLAMNCWAWSYNQLEGTFLGRRECDHNTQLIFLLCVKWPGQGGIRYIQELNILLYKLLRDLPVGKPAFSWAFSVKRWHMEKGSPCQLWIFFVVRKSMLSCKIVLLNFYSPMMLLPSGDKKQ